MNGNPTSQTPDTETDMSEPTGTFACPICGVDVPHPHTEEEQAAYREEQVSGRWYNSDGWNRTLLRRPKERGWYLCRGVEVPRDQYGPSSGDIWNPNERWSQLSWFLWVREAARGGLMDEEICEVLHFDPMHNGFTLRNFLGNAVVSGAESRRPVVAYPKYWRRLPEFSDPKCQHWTWALDGGGFCVKCGKDLKP